MRRSGWQVLINLPHLGGTLVKQPEIPEDLVMLRDILKGYLTDRVPMEAIFNQIKLDDENQAQFMIFIYNRNTDIGWEIIKKASTDSQHIINQDTNIEIYWMPDNSAVLIPEGDRAYAITPPTTYQKVEGVAKVNGKCSCGHEYGCQCSHCE